MGLSIRDSVIATVSCSTSKGIYVELENGQTAYAAFDRLPGGTTVYCTVLKKATEQWLTLVSIDSVLYDVSDSTQRSIAVRQNASSKVI